MLSDKDIKKALEDKWIEISPLDQGYIQPSSVDLRVGTEFRVFENHKYSHIDPKSPQEDLTTLVEASKDEPFVLHPGEFVLGTTYEKVALSIRELDGNPFDEIKDKQKGDIVTCTVAEISDYGVKVAIGENGPKVVIKKNDLAIQKADARPERWAKNDKLDAMITQIDASNLKIALSIRALEEKNEKDALEKYGSKDSGASLGDILGKAISDKKSEE